MSMVRVPTRQSAGAWWRAALVGSTTLALLTLTVPALAKEPLYTSGGLALSGYDTVAYFSDGKPVKGRPEYETQWGGPRWQFASASWRA